MIAEIRSGGQTGVDIASLRAAKALGVRTGGVMPKGFKTLAGPRPEWAREFGLTEHDSPNYPPRTRANVEQADVTIRIAYDFTSAGERCTAAACRKSGRPLVDVYVIDGTSTRFAVPRKDLDCAVGFLADQRRRLGRDLIVNFAGNSEKTAPGIERAAERIVTHLLERCLKG